MVRLTGLRASVGTVLFATVTASSIIGMTQGRTAFAMTPGVGAVASSAPASRAAAVSGQVPDVRWSYFVPQTGPLVAPTEGMEAIQYFRICPNNDGASSLPFNARIKIVALDMLGLPIPGIAAEDIFIPLNGGTPAQGFSGVGADSVIANSQWNSSPLCPDVRYLFADAPTDARGTTFITFAGADPAAPGVTRRDSNRKWGHYDSELSVFVLGIKLSGRLETGLPNDTYTLRIKNMDWTGGLGPAINQGEVVTISDFNGVAYSVGLNSPVSYWKDLDNSGSVDFTDISIITYHLNHNCSTPQP